MHRWPTSRGEVSCRWRGFDKYALRQQKRHPELPSSAESAPAAEESVEGLWSEEPVALMPPLSAHFGHDGDGMRSVDDGGIVYVCSPGCVLCCVPVLSVGYQKFVDPGVSPEFQAAAMRFGISMAPPGVYMRYCCAISIEPLLKDI